MFFTQNMVFIIKNLSLKMHSPLIKSKDELRNSEMVLESVEINQPEELLSTFVAKLIKFEN